MLTSLMTPVPPPASPCVRVRLDYLQSDNFRGGNRFFLSYSGSAPTVANCNSLAADVATAWNTSLAEMFCTNWSLQEVDVLDIANDSGNSGNSVTAHEGTRSGDAMPAQCAFNIEYQIARRYRGGKPRIYLPLGVFTDLVNQSTWSDAMVTEANSQWGAFMAAITGASVGAMGTLTHVNLSYYKGFTNIENSSGRERAVPTYRSAAVVDPVINYLPHNEISSQRRRRAATTY